MSINEMIDRIHKPPTNLVRRIMGTLQFIRQCEEGQDLFITRREEMPSLREALLQIHNLSAIALMHLGEEEK